MRIAEREGSLALQLALEACAQNEKLLLPPTPGFLSTLGKVFGGFAFTTGAIVGISLIKECWSTVEAVAVGMLSFGSSVAAVYCWGSALSAFCIDETALKLRIETLKAITAAAAGAAKNKGGGG